MFIAGLILALLGFLVLGMPILGWVGVVLMVIALCGNGYAHFGTPAGTRRRYWY